MPGGGGSSYDEIGAKVWFVVYLLGSHKHHVVGYHSVFGKYIPTPESLAHVHL